MSRAGRAIGPAAILAGVILLGLRAQQSDAVKIDPRATPPLPPRGETASARTNLRIDSNLVLVPVSVCDPMNKPVTGLEKEHFKIFDDKVEQTITHFAMDDEPVDVGLVFDISGSMGNKLRRSRMAASAFFKTANPEDEFFLVEFNDQPKLVVPLTKDTGEIQNQLTFAESKGRTALMDAMFLAMHEMKKSTKTRKALLIISDGGDNSSRYTETELRARVRESDVLIYAIGIFESGGGRDRSPEESNGPALLERSRRTDRRPRFRRGRYRRNARHRGEDWNRTAQPLRAGLFAHRGAARRQVSSRAGEGDSSARIAAAQGLLAAGIFRASELKPVHPSSVIASVNGRRKDNRVHIGQ